MKFGEEKNPINVEYIYIGGPWDGTSTKSGMYLRLGDPNPGSISYAAMPQGELFARYVEGQCKDNVVKLYFIGYGQAPWKENDNDGN
jgi:hypothetical protein